MKRILLFCLIGLTTFSCVQDHALPQADACRLAQFVEEAGPNEFTYDPNGNIAKWLITAVFNDGKKQTVNYDFSRDGTGRISSLTQTITFDGKAQAPAVARFIYTNGLLTATQTTIGSAQAPTIFRAFTNDSNGRMSKRVVTDQTSGFTSTEIYEYDSRGNCTKYNYTDSDSKIELVYTYDTSRNPEQFLIKSIPFNLLSGQPWSVNTILTAKETYMFPTGTDIYTGKQTDLKTDAKGYVSSYTLTYDDGYVAKRTYSLTGCN